MIIFVLTNMYMGIIDSLMSARKIYVKTCPLEDFLWVISKKGDIHESSCEENLPIISFLTEMTQFFYMLVEHWGLFQAYQFF